MPIEVSCTGCQRRLRVPDRVAGKRIKCPKCSSLINVPDGAEATPALPQQPTGQSHQPHAYGAQATPALPQQPATPDWFVKTEDGQQYGPITRQELDEWVSEDRLTSRSQVMHQGKVQWATDLYPQLAQPAPAPAPMRAFEADPGTYVPGVSVPAAHENPFASPESNVHTGASGRSSSQKRSKRCAAVDFVAIFSFILAAIAGIMGLYTIVQILDTDMYNKSAFLFGALLGAGFVISIPSAIGIGLTKRQEWARIMALVLSPIGSLLGLWVIITNVDIVMNHQDVIRYTGANESQYYILIFRGVLYVAYGIVCYSILLTKLAIQDFRGTKRR